MDEMRKVTIDVKAQVIIEMDDEIKVEDVVAEIDKTLEYDFMLEGTNMVDTDIQNYEVIDSK